jgi:hypothetical protein
VSLTVPASRQPLRVRAFVGRLLLAAALVDRFNRTRYAADRIVAAFADRMRDAIELPNLAGDLDRMIHQAIAPERLGIWLRGTRE